MCELEDFTIVSVLQFSHHDIKVKKSRKSMYNLFWVNWEWPLSHLTFAQWWSARFHQRSCLFSSVQALSRVRLCNPTDWSMPGLHVHHQFQELTQTHVHWVSDAIQSSHPLLSPSPPALNLSQHQGLFQWVSSSHQVAKVLEFQLQHQSFQWIFRTDLL